MGEKSDFKDGFLRFLSAGIGACLAETSTLPIDISKVRLQTQKPLPDGTLPYRNMFQAMAKVSSEEGFPALWKGITPALIRQFCYTGLSFAFYEPVRNFVAGEGVKKEDIPAWKRVLAGGIAGGSSIIIVNPTDVVKTQMQTATGQPQIMKIARNVWKGEGIAGFWKGVNPNVARCFIGNACEIGFYDTTKQNLLANDIVDDGPLAHFSASTVAGTISAIFSTPVDVVKTRLMNQAGGRTDVHHYKGVIDCFVNMPKQEGIGSLYKGFWPLAARKVFWTISYFLCYEQVRGAIMGEYS